MFSRFLIDVVIKGIENLYVGGHVGVGREVKLEIGAGSIPTSVFSQSMGSPLPSNLASPPNRRRKKPSVSMIAGPPLSSLANVRPWFRAYAQQVEEIGGHPRALDLLGIVAGERTRYRPNPRHARQRAVAPLDLAQDGARDRSARVAGCAETGPDYREAFGVIIGQRVQHDAVEDTEDGGIHADSRGPA